VACVYCVYVLCDAGALTVLLWSPHIEARVERRVCCDCTTLLSHSASSGGAVYVVQCAHRYQRMLIASLLCANSILCFLLAAEVTHQALYISVTRVIQHGLTTLVLDSLAAA
jgi:hypothetical protein